MKSIITLFAISLATIAGSNNVSKHTVDLNGKLSDTSTSTVASNAGVIVYSGRCIRYTKNLVQGNKAKYTPSDPVFAKIVINTSTKKFTFFYNGNVVFTANKYLSYIDDNQGGEGFTFDSDRSAHLFTAERTFVVYDQAGTFGSKQSFMGYEYEISDYKIN